MGHPMKTRMTSRPEAGLNLFEVGVIIAVVALLAVLLVPWLIESKRKANIIACNGYLKNVGLAYRVWAGDNGDMNPMGLSVTNGGTMEMVATGDVVQTFLVMSNELATPVILYCPNDSRGQVRNRFTGLANSNISYFISADVTNGDNPQAILSGDGNFELGGKPVNPGLLSVGTNDPVGWSASRHILCGNLVMGDGSVQQVTSNGLRISFLNANMATNRLAIP